MQRQAGVHSQGSDARARLLELLASKQRAPAATAATEPDIDAIQRLPAGSVPRLSFAQEGLWFLEQLLGPSALYNIVRATRLSGPLNVPALEAGLQQVIGRHDSLRTRFFTRDGVAEQRAWPMADVSLPVIDAQACSPAELEALLGRHAAAPFDLAAAPPWRALLLRCAEQEHILLWVVHHIVADGWSMSVMARELAGHYADATSAAPASRFGCAPLRLQFADCAAWQRARHEAGELDQEVAFWRHRLAGLTPLELPTDRPRSVQASACGASLEFTLPGTKVVQLNALAKAHGATLFMVLLGVFKVMLKRLAGQDDVTVGSPVAGRNRAEFEDQVGYFVNSLVLRSDLGGHPSFGEVLRRVRQTTLDALDHQELPFDRLVAELSPERNLSRNPLYQVSFALQSYPTDTVELLGLRSRRVAVPLAISKFDLSLTFTEVAGQLAGSFEYATDLFEAATIERWKGHFTTLLDAVLDDPSIAIDRAPLLDADERTRMLVQWNDTACSRPDEETLHQLFETAARVGGSSIAAIEGERSNTYAELDARANALASQLRALGVGPEVRVAVCMGRSLDMLTALLGVLKSGGAYVPLDPQYPAERLDYMLADCGATVILTDASSRARLPVTTAAVLELPRDLAGPAPSAVALSESPRRAASDHLAYVIYTSGSTGRPKGVQITHRGICNHVRWMVHALAIDSHDVFLQKTSISFDASLVEIFVPLSVGATTVLAQGDGERDSQYLAETLAQQRITVLQAVPSALGALLQEPAITHCTHLRRVICGGESLDRELARELQLVLPQARLGNFYGPTEASIDATWHDVDSVPAGAGVVSIGRPVSNARCHILDALMQPVPVGVLGELFVGGRGLARGYLGRPELDLERFVPDPFQPGQKLYRTGDLARYLADGTIECVGRADDQVKLRGFRIELGEIEAVAQSLPGVGPCIVLLREDRPGVRQLVAYLEGDAALASAVREGLRQRLPDHMVPAQVIALQPLPRLPNGKLDRKSLPAPALAVARAEPSAARSALELTLLDIWTSVLAVDRIGIHDNFFDLGGHSLMATRIAARARAQLHDEVPLRWLFEHPTVAALAAQIERTRHQGALSPRPVLRCNAAARSLPRRAPVSFAQRRMWLLQQRDPQGAAYNMTLAHRLQGDLNRAALRAALDDLVQSHEAFGTVFEMGDHEPMQVIGEPQALVLGELDLSHLPPNERPAQLARSLRALGRLPFDLSKPPLYRFTLIRLDALTHVLLMVIHHAIGDEWSFGVLMRQLSQRYRLHGDGQATAVARPAIDYADYAAWQRGSVDARSLDALWQHWRERLSGFVPLALPYDRPLPLTRSTEGGRVHLTLPLATVHRLREFSAARAVSPAMTLLAAFVVQLRAYTGQDDITLGSPVANRTALEVEELVGVMVNTLLLRHDTSGKPSFEQLLQKVRATALAAYAHQDMPYDLLVERLRAHADGAAVPDLQVMFNVLNTPAEPLALAGLECEAERIDRGTVQLDLSLQIDLEQSREVLLTYAADVFDAATAQRWLEAYPALLDELLSQPRLSLGEVMVGSPREREQLARWNATEVAYDLAACAHHGFRRQVERTPLATALSDGSSTLSYAELEVRANRLARLLRAHGAGRGMLIGLCVERSCAMVVAQLAVLKAGAAYVPLDPAYPAERLAYMAEDAQLGLLITETPLASLLPWPRERSIRLDEVAAQLAALPGGPLAEDAQRDARPGDAAYVIYTSGSTGKPKGVVVPHTAVVNFLDSMAREPGLVPEDRVVAVTTLSFDIAVLELLLPLSVGAQVILAPRDVALDGRALKSLIDATAATVMQATPSTWRLLLESGWAGSPGFKALIGGEPLPRDLAEALLQCTGSLWNMYGPTETTVWSTCARVESIDKGISIGRPIANTQIHILDEHLQPRPVGAVGEICIGGAGVTLGYLHRPELTAERFVPYPPAGSSAQMPTQRVYRTGDLGRWRSDGTLEHLGRMDSQVKVRGHRIELGEIESALAMHPSVARAVVATHEFPGADVRLVAYLVCRGEMPSATALRAHLAASLPEYMQPQLLMAVDAIPLLPNGKVDRRALPAPSLGPVAPAAGPASDAVLPGSDTERAMAQLWQRLLNLPQPVGVTQAFFDLGGHSLLAARLVRAIEQELGFPCSLQLLYRAPTVRALCAELLLGRLPQGAEVVALAEQGAADKLFCICGVHLYKALADTLAPQFSVHGIFLPYEQTLLEAKPGAGVQWPTVQGMAADYVSAMRLAQPQGPYRLAGVSFGGVLAFEMAQQLRRAGEEVAFLGLLDSMLPGTIQRQLLPRVMRRARRLIDQLAASLRSRSAAAESAQPGAVDAQEQRIARQREAIYLRAIRLYRPAPYAGYTVLARSQDQELQTGETIDPSYRWGPLVPNLHSVDVPGDHLGLLRPPHVAELAAELRPHLLAASALQRSARTGVEPMAQPTAGEAPQQEAQAAISCLST